MARYETAGQDVPSPVRETQVNSQLSRMDDALQHLEGNIGTLIAALSPVSRNEPPTNAKEIAKVAELIVPVADRIRSYKERVDALADAVNSARDRLEI